MVSNHTIRVQRIGNYFVPTDSQSSQALETILNINGFDLQHFDLVTPRIVKRGFALAVENYGDGQPVRTHGAPLPY